MEKQQAIDLLDNLIGMIEDNQDNDYDAAFRMAIEALKAQHSQEGTTKGTTSDMNNQVNLCDSCTYTYPECPSEKDDVIFGNGIGNDNICACNKYQPTVQPVATDIISRQAAIDALDCINGVEEVLRSLPPAQPNLQPTCNQLAIDTISRQAAIDGKISIQRANGVEIYSDEAVPVEYLKRLPTIQPERAEGEWVKIQRCARDAQPDLECPFCKHRIGWWDMGRYCAGCGAKLKGGAE